MPLALGELTDLHRLRDMLGYRIEVERNVPPRSKMDIWPNCLQGKEQTVGCTVQVRHMSNSCLR